LIELVLGLVTFGGSTNTIPVFSRPFKLVISPWARSKSIDPGEETESLVPRSTAPLLYTYD